jgi:hypothetical protein
MRNDVDEAIKRRDDGESLTTLVFYHLFLSKQSAIVRNRHHAFRTLCFQSTVGTISIDCLLEALMIEIYSYVSRN